MFKLPITDRIALTLTARRDEDCWCPASCKGKSLLEACCLFCEESIEIFNGNRSDFDCINSDYGCANRCDCSVWDYAFENLERVWRIMTLLTKGEIIAISLKFDFEGLWCGHDDFSYKHCRKMAHIPCCAFCPEWSEEGVKNNVRCGPDRTPMCAFDTRITVKSSCSAHNMVMEVLWDREDLED